jgi:hypothetical protein
VFVNDVRAALGEPRRTKLLVGNQARGGTSCPITRSIGQEYCQLTNVGLVVLNPTTLPYPLACWTLSNVPVPRKVKKFIERFDTGCYPELVAKSPRIVNVS